MPLTGQTGSSVDAIATNLSNSTGCLIVHACNETSDAPLSFIPVVKISTYLKLESKGHDKSPKQADEEVKQMEDFLGGPAILGYPP
jgi:hypothetical protein